ncbi:hypothetical protein BC332_30420 [Capsicum chinense]|nr:hypothetical protein BC332_30420 [Capsicum chinense]
MEAKNHCRVHYGDGDDDEEAKLEEFYDHTSRFVDKTGTQIVLLDDTSNSAELGSGGSELIITTRSARYGSMGLATVQSREHMVELKVLKAMNKSGVENMHNKIGMKSNVIRNLPKNIPY